MSERRVLVRNMIVRWGNQLSAVLIGFFLSPFIIHSLGEEQYGLWALIAGSMGLLIMLDFGVAAAVNRQVARLHSLGQTDQINHLLSSGAALYSLIALLLGAITVVVAIYFTSIFDKVKAQDDLVARVLVLGLGLNMGMTIVTRLFAGVVMGMQRFDLLDYLHLAYSVLRWGAIIICFLAGLVHVWVLLFATFGANVLQQAVAVVLACRMHKGLRLRWRWINRGDMKYLLAFSATGFLVLMAWVMSEQGAKLVIGKFLTLELVTQFTQAAMLAGMMRFWPQALPPMILPAASAIYAQGDMSRLSRMRDVACKYTLAMSIMLQGTLVIFGDYFLGRWMHWTGPEYHGAYLCIIALAVGHTFATWQAPTSSVVRGMNRQAPYAVVFPLCMVIGLGLGIMLALKADLGIFGVALGLMIGQIIRTIYMPWHGCRLLKTSTLMHVWRTAATPVVCGVPMVILGLVLRFYVKPTTYPALVWTMGLTCAVYAVGAYVLVLEPSERNKIKSTLAKVVEKVRGK